MFAAADDAAIDRIVAELRVDGVVVEEPIGYGKPKVFHDRLVRLAAEQDFPTYVVLTDKPLYGTSYDSAEATIDLLSRRLGEAKAFIIVGNNQSTVRARLVGIDPALDTRRSLSSSSGSEEVKRLAKQVLLPDPIDAEIYLRSAAPALAAAQREEEPANQLAPNEAAALAAEAAQLTEWEAVHFADGDEDIAYANPSKTAFWSTLLGALVALLVGQSVRGWPRRGKGPVQLPAVANADALRAQAQMALGQLSEYQAEHPPHEVTTADSEAVTEAQLARDAAESLIDSTRVDDLEGARSLAVYGLRRLQGAETGTPVARTCFFHPEHGDDTQEIEVAAGAVEGRVPLCADCAKAVAANQAPAMFTVGSRSGPVPYYEEDTVWARTGFGALSQRYAADVQRLRGAR